jgi:hypothetical protein
VDAGLHERTTSCEQLASRGHISMLQHASGTTLLAGLFFLLFYGIFAAGGTLFAGYALFHAFSALTMNPSRDFVRLGPATIEHVAVRPRLAEMNCDERKQPPCDLACVDEFVTNFSCQDPVLARLHPLNTHVESKVRRVYIEKNSRYRLGYTKSNSKWDSTTADKDCTSGASTVAPTFSPSKPPPQCWMPSVLRSDQEEYASAESAEAAVRWSLNTLYYDCGSEGLCVKIVDPATYHPSPVGAILAAAILLPFSSPFLQIGFGGVRSAIQFMRGETSSFEPPPFPSWIPCGPLKRIYSRT